jgi:hypothetical protein
MNSMQTLLVRRAAVVITILVIAFILSSMVLAFPVSAYSGKVSPEYLTSASKLDPSAPATIRVDKNPHWSGYADLSTKGSVSSVEASFVLPSVTCNSSSPQEQEMYFFAALDNLSKSDDFEYAGALAYCPLGYSTPSYYAINNVSFIISTVTPNAGDIISASISVVSGNFVYNVTDITNGETSVQTASAGSASLNSAEVLTDTGNCGNATVQIDCPITIFKSVSFGGSSTHITGTCYATIGGKTEPIGGFGTSTKLFKGVTTNEAGNVTDLATSALNIKETSFKAIFKHPGP